MIVELSEKVGDINKVCRTNRSSLNDPVMKGFSCRKWDLGTVIEQWLELKSNKQTFGMCWLSQLVVHL